MGAKKYTNPGTKISPEFSHIVETILKGPEGHFEDRKDLKDYIRLIMAIAKPYVRQRVEWEDLIMAGVVGLLKARRDFDPARSSKFKTFASICILGEIYSYCQANNNLVSIPTHISKASNYIGKMSKLVRGFANGDPSEDTIDAIVLEESNELAKTYLTPELIAKLQYNKDRVKSIARNSSLTYEELAALAKKSLVSTVSETAVAGFSNTSSDTENRVCERELQELLRRSLGEKRFAVVELHYQGYSNPEIAQILHERGYSNTKGGPVSRSAIKSLLDNALAAIRKMAVFKDGQRDGVEG
jgi:RNA polymerase sigma factor (sigma-70 family)